ncbi:EAL domain-containing protein [Collinsella aerofaciens]|uniref:Cyclic-di-GMP phosphodiesterase YjcC n=1 Tax=Collinsella aerofaciens TaxID=74426 RepID=A0A5K1IJ57_9ACTN|nr:EAL domain-containing protein [Collinsella aerofaciens]VWL86824.1 Putative cyclic-di-GMP phosphodiesterase YjcC [Collinsella aerofaciens]
MDTDSNYTETLEKTVRDLLERQEDLIRTAFTDQLTGLGNRGGFAHSLEEIWEQELPVTMAFIDIDNLKHCNDIFGHDEGNRYILQVSLYLKLYMKVDEAAFRLGGDEFAILSTIATEDDLAERLERCRTILLKNNDSEMPHSFSYGVSHADPALGEAPNRMTLDADHRMYDYKLRHAMHLDRRNITQVHADDFEISDRVFDAFSMLNEGRYFFIENLDKHRILWSQGALRDLGLPSEHIDNYRDYWKTRVHPDDLEACIDDIDQVYNGTKHRRVMQYRVRNAAGGYVLCRVRGFRIDGDGNVPSLYVGELVNHSLVETVDAATGLGTQRMLVNAIDACRRDRCETGLIAVRVRGTAKLNELYGAEAVDNMLAEYAGRMLSITRGRSRVYRSRSVQFVVLSNDLGREAFEQLTRHLKEAVFAPIRIAGDTITPVCLVVPAFYEHLTHQTTAVLGELDRRLRTAGGLVPNDSLPIPEAERKSAIAERIDSLTGLYRPSEFMRRANTFLKTRRDGTWCVATVDMGHMRLFNEWHGQAEGDRVLADVGTVLKNIENGDMGVAGHWGQDDFCILIPFEHNTIHQIYSRVREAVARHDDGVGFWPSMGVYPIDSSEEITIDAQAKAMYTNQRAKNDFKERIAIFCPAEYDREVAFHRTLTEFQYALSNGRITYHLQPQVDMKTGEIIGAEALTRWIDKDSSLISPATFIPALEESGFVVTLDKYIWQGVASWLRERINRGLRVVPISLNVSRVDILACDVAEYMGALAAQNNLPPKLMRIEITETAYTGESEAVDKLTADLHARGFSTYMDDFGTGQSTLAMLKNVNVDVIKLDRAFVPVDGDHGRSTQIISSMLEMAHSLHLPVVVEGVETNEQANMLRQMGARYAQGFLYYRPMPAKDFEVLLDGGNNN